MNEINGNNVVEMKQKSRTTNEELKSINDWTSQTYTDSGRVKTTILTAILAEHIRNNSHYKFVRNNATSGVFIYWYSGGCYKLTSENELKGYIKSLISLEFQKTKDINEVFNLLITDLKFIPYDRLNSNENIINFENGLLYIDTMELKEHTPDVMTTTQIPCNWNVNATPVEGQHFDKFMDHLTSGNNEVKSLLMQFIGVCVSNIKGYRLKKALFMVGAGDVGKSQLKELTHRLLGIDNVSGIDLETLESRFGTATIFNKRLIGSSDMSYTTVKELKSFKKATGGDMLHAEFKGMNSFEFIYNGLVWFCSNQLPKFGGDRGDWVYNRVMVCECNNPVEKKDKYLQDKMFKEREYIIQLVIKELKNVIANDYEFIVPGTMIEATEKYKINNDSFLFFLEECTKERPNNKITDSCDRKRVYDVYKAWCADNNNGYNESNKNVKDKLHSMGLDEIKIVNGNRYYSKFTLSLETKKEYQGVYGMDRV